MIYSKINQSHGLIRRNDCETEEEEQKTQNKDSQFQIQPSNQLYFYSDVTRDSIYLLNRQLAETQKQLQFLQINYDLVSPPPIKLHISSEGGEVFSCFSAIDRIRNSKVPVDTYIEGIAASCATMLSVVGRRRYINKHAVMLIHSVSSGLWGNYQEFKDEKQNLDLLMKFIKNIYLNHTKFKEPELDEILKHDLYLTPEECLEKGLVDEII